MGTRITIITISFNSEKTLEQTIKSVVGQGYDNLEYIIIDGGSTDGTLDIVNRYRNYITVVVSEKDTGISDAFNKGIVRASGEVIGIINSDDLLADGALAALSVLRNLPPREVKAIHVQSALLKAGVNLSLCAYSDVPPEHKHNRNIQLSNLYGLLEPKEYPSNETHGIPTIMEVTGDLNAGRFGVDESLSDEDRQKLSARVKELTGSELSLPEGEITRGDAVDFAVKAMEKM